MWGRVVVKPLDTETKSQGGIVLVEETVKKEQRTQMKAVLIKKAEDAFEDWKQSPKVGDTLIIDKYAGFHITTNEIEYRLMNDDQIIAIVEGSNE